MVKRSIIAVGFSVSSVLLPFAATATSFSRLYGFGDSLSDPGNIYNVTNFARWFDSSIPVIPSSPPYYEGRFSNGPIWVDYLAEDLGLTLTPSTDLSVFLPNLPIPSPIAITPTGDIGVSFFFKGKTANQSVNFAFGGAQTGFTGTGELGDRIPGVLTQVAGFTNDLGNQLADPNALYIVWAGANDYQTVEPENPQESVGNLATAITSLFDVGARNFLVPNLPDLGRTPQALSLGTEASTNLTNLTNTHNTTLATTLTTLDQTLADINLAALDVYTMFNQMLSAPAQFGVTNITQPCLDPVTLISCPNPNEYLFWDGIHPTTVTHERLAELAFTALTPTPEPEAVQPLVSSAQIRVLSNETEPEAESIPEPTSIVALGGLGLAWVLLGRRKVTR